ncbi:BTAD domain-containing putative transcriptional regulator [Streptomyces sp. NPDC001381]|uniref:AfsR/SARP family transcriptional regulator n=1 Tax=Streptomyces sp. NPDC001381 TaxID=3364567 RepID=UPI0036ACAE12
MKDEGKPRICFSLLGQVRAHQGDHEIDLGSPQQRAVAAALLLAQGRPLTVNDLVEAVWERPPNSPASVVRTYVWRLRNALEPGHPRSQPWRILRSVAGGYLLDADDDCVDWQAFQRHVGEARARRADGDHTAALLAYGRALALWQGDPLASVPGPLADRERSRIQAQHLDVLEERLHLQVDAGHYAEAITGASALVEHHPLREGLHQVLMHALYRAGRQADALAVYRRVHRILDEELGIAPGPDLRALHARILRADRPAPAPPNPEAARRRTPIPRQLPHAAADFTGRVPQTERVHDALLRHPAHAMPIVLVTGMGGVGKTALVMHSVQSVLAAYPDGQLHTDLRGAGGTPADPGSVLSAFLRALGLADSVIPDELDERAALYRTVLAQRRVLIVLDDAADMEQILPLLPGSPTCAVVVTSRNSLAPLPVSLRVTLRALPDDEALDLFTRLVGSARVAAEPQIARQVLASCGGLPLAIRVIGSRLAARPEWSLARLAERLADERHRLSGIPAGRHAHAAVGGVPAHRRSRRGPLPRRAGPGTEP